MRTNVALGAMLLAAVLSGCAIGNQHLVLDPVGPAPAKWTGTGSNPGTLVVYSGYRVNADFNTRDTRRPEYSDYAIYTPDGKLLKRVHNNNGTMFQDAVPVDLPPGKYSVMARANGYGFVSVPVLIKPQQSTVVHLESGVAWPESTGMNRSNAVYLPDGAMVGWRADL